MTAAARGDISPHYEVNSLGIGNLASEEIRSDQILLPARFQEIRSHPNAG
jgi:hypothetical protein